MIVTGGPDNIRIWSVQSGHALQRILLGGKDTIVWCLAVTRSVLICMCVCVHVRERERECVCECMGLVTTRPKVMLHKQTAQNEMI